MKKNKQLIGKRCRGSPNGTPFSSRNRDCPERVHKLELVRGFLTGVFAFIVHSPLGVLLIR
jgi:hypothetical protein